MNTINTDTIKEEVVSNEPMSIDDLFDNKLKSSYDRQSNKYTHWFVLPEESQNYTGITHGGFSFTMIDKISKYSICSILKETNKEIVHPFLVKQGINYIKPLKPEREMKIELSFKKIKSTSAVIMFDVYDKKGSLSLSGESIYRISSVAKF